MEVDDFRDALINAANHRKPLTVFKDAECGVLLIRDVKVFEYEGEAPYCWVVSDVRTGDDDEIDGGFTSMEEAAEDCAEWLVSQGYVLH